MCAWPPASLDGSRTTDNICVQPLKSIGPEAVLAPKTENGGGETVPARRSRCKPRRRRDLSCHIDGSGCRWRTSMAVDTANVVCFETFRREREQRQARVLPYLAPVEGRSPRSPFG